MHATVQALEYPYAPYNAGKMDPQLTGWPLNESEKAYVLKPEHDRRPGREINQHKPELWPVIPSAGFWGGTSWLEMHASLVKTVEANRGPVDVLLVGDSITIQWGGEWAKNFPSLKAVNIGIGGDKTQNVLWRLDHGGVEGLQPRAIMLMIGNNNMFFAPETGIEAAARGVEMCVKNVREKFPQAPVIVAKILPCHAPGVPFYENIKKTNLALDALKLGSDPMVTVLDLWNDFTQADGTLMKELFTPDNIHLSSAGYAAYAARLKLLLDRRLGGKGVGGETLMPLAMPLATNALALVKKPNILFLITDDLATRLGCYGDKAAITPNLDRLAREGVLFNRAYAQGSVCIPSRTSFMLGLNNRHAGADHFKRNPETMTLGRWFRMQGYQTFSVGKVDHDETYTDPKAWDIRVPIKDCKRGAPSKSTLQPFNEDLGRKRVTGHRYKTEENPESLDDWGRTTRALEFLERERSAEKPFFAVVGFHAPHDPWYASKAVYEMFDPLRFTLEWPSPAGIFSLPPKSLLVEPGFDMSESRQREGQRYYYSAVATLDQQVGRIMESLRAKGLMEKTVIVFVSDQGFHLGWRGQWHKHTISEQVLNAPLIVRLPQGPQGAKVNGIVELLDLFPTFCDLAGLPAPEGLDGKSFLPLLKDPKAPGKPAAFCSMPVGWGNGRTVRTSRWRLVERLDGSRELYDHNTDTREYQNLIDQPEHTQLVARLHDMLEKEFGPLKKEAPRHEK
jgi:arylsulfatase A-like enzyme/lysophospholipase L1-like esterase